MCKGRLRAPCQTLAPQTYMCHRQMLRWGCSWQHCRVGTPCRKHKVLSQSTTQGCARGGSHSKGFKLLEGLLAISCYQARRPAHLRDVIQIWD